MVRRLDKNEPARQLIVGEQMFIDIGYVVIRLLAICVETLMMKLRNCEVDLHVPYTISMDSLDRTPVLPSL